jgi:penicillin-binding protein 1A
LARDRRIPPPPPGPPGSQSRESGSAFAPFEPFDDADDAGAALPPPPRSPQASAPRSGGRPPSGPPRSLPPRSHASRQPPTSSGSPRRLAKRPSLAWRLVRIAAMVFFIAGLGAAGAAYSWLDAVGVFDVSPERLDAIAKHKSADNTLVFDRDGQKIGEFFDSYHVYVPYKELPKSFVQALIAIEDRTFWTHPGYDLKGMARAGWASIKGGHAEQGASTLTQQLVRNFLLTPEKTAQRKILEIAYAIQLEKRLKKERILELYANSLFLGNGSYGVGAAALRYFGKPAAELEPHEAALIAGLYQLPSRYNPSRYPKRAKKRQERVIRAMRDSGMIDAKTAKAMIAKKLEYKEYKPLNTQFAPYFVDYVKEKSKELLDSKKVKVDGQGLRIYTTIDVKLQKLAEEAVAASAPLLDTARERTQRLKTADGKIVPATLEAAILTTDPQTGEILAMVGGRDYARTKYNRTWQALRSPGSAFKPVVYSLALQKKWKWSDVIYVSPVTINNYRPHTPDEDYLTETTVLRAFYRSMNTPTIELGEKLGLGPVIEQARKLGIRTPIKEEFGSLLGSSDTTMLDLARMYSTFANQGKVVEQVAITKILDRRGKTLYQAPGLAERTKEAISPQIAYLMTQGMRAVLAMGTGFTAAHLSGVAAGKTGTSNDATDNWFAGYSRTLTSIVWVGTDEHASIHGDTTGGKLALPIWDRYMTKAFELRKPGGFPAPPGIVTTVVHPKFGNRSPDGVRMYFLRGNEPPADSSALEALSQSADGYRDVFQQ